VERHDAQNCDQRSWFVTSWWNWISDVLTMLPRALGQRSACACLSAANFSWTSSPRRSWLNLDALKLRMAS
jgi:hypothetical protein